MGTKAIWSAAVLLTILLAPLGANVQRPARAPTIGVLSAWAVAADAPSREAFERG